ncbi:hypothetical protein BJ165DRAFT_1511645 [Panaeolus papilionaceus]|nr:hypothetical protein BJ165DRAFT_1511645 [Panaeolus papilionaceus]
MKLPSMPSVFFSVSLLSLAAQASSHYAHLNAREVSLDSQNNHPGLDELNARVNVLATLTTRQLEYELKSRLNRRIDDGFGANKGILGADSGGDADSEKESISMVAPPPTTHDNQRRPGRSMLKRLHKGSS